MSCVVRSRASAASSFSASFDRLVHELLDDRLAPRTERAPAEAAAEPLHAGDADALQLAGVAVEHDQPGVDEDLADLVGFARLEVVIAEHRRRRECAARSAPCARTGASSGRP